MLFSCCFPGGSDGKESACNGKDLGLITRLEDHLEEGMITHSSTLAWRIPIDRGAWRASGHGCDGGGKREGLVLCGGCPGSVPLSLAPLHPEHPTMGHARASLNPGQHPEIPEKRGLGPDKAEPPAPSCCGHTLCTSGSCAPHYCPDSSW